MQIDESPADIPLEFADSTSSAEPARSSETRPAERVNLQ
jgi:hypothetical protein